MQSQNKDKNMDVNTLSNEEDSDSDEDDKEVTKDDTPWLYARNNKYTEKEVDYSKVGKWMLFPLKSDVNYIWEKIKCSIKQGHLWISKVSTSPEEQFHAIMIYTKDYTDLKDVIRVLDYIESSGLKPPHKVIKYKTDEMTRAGIYSSPTQKASIYSSNTIRAKLQAKSYANFLSSWLKSNGCSNNIDPPS